MTTSTHTHTCTTTHHANATTNNDDGHDSGDDDDDDVDDMVVATALCLDAPFVAKLKHCLGLLNTVGVAADT